MKLSVCIPMYNESAAAEASARGYAAALDRMFGEDYELIYCDDGSLDGCGDIVRSLGLPRVRVIGYTPNRGKGSAVRTAVMAAEGDLILYTDCDCAYGTDKIGEAVKRLDGSPETDVLIGSRNLGGDGYEGYTFLRKLMSKTYIFVIRTVAGFRHSDSQCGFKAWRRGAGKAVFALCETDGFAFDIEALLLAEKFGYRIDEMPVKVINHAESTSKVHPIRDTLRMLRDLVKIKRHVKSVSAVRDDESGTVGS